MTIATDRYYVVVGLGMTGMSVVRYLSRHKLNFCVMDSRAEPPGLDELQREYPEAAVYAGYFDREVLRNAYSVILSPGVPRDNEIIAELIAAEKSVTSDVEIFLQEVRGRVVGVTGSNGKSTVVTALGKVAMAAGVKAVVAGNIGIPVLDLLEQDYELYILELSSFQLENIKSPALDVACVLNVSPDHMDRHKNIQSYFKAKQRIYFSAKAVVYNLEDRLTIPPTVAHVKRAGFALKKMLEENETQYWYDAETRQLMCGDELLMAYDDIRIKGLHNVANALAVFAIANLLEINSEVVARELQIFKGLAHRCEWVAEQNAVTFINDSKATNSGASEAAILGLKDDYKKIFLIAGGDAKGADFSSLAGIIRSWVHAAILIGRDAEHIAAAIADGVNVYRALNMQAAVTLAYQLAEPGSLVLLSPACASFDMYGGYEERGREFVRAVEEVCA